MIEPASFNPTARRFNAAFPAYLATAVRAERLAEERRQRELYETLEALKQEKRLAIGAGGGLGGPLITRMLVAASRFDPKKISGCVLDLDPSDLSTWSATSASIAAGSDFTSGSWTTGDVTTIGNDTTAPDGTTTADRITSSSTSGNCVKYQTITNAATTVTRVHEVYVKRNDVDWIAIGTRISGTSYSWFNINTGTVGTQGSTNSDHSIVSVGNGWWRIRVTRASTNPTPTFVLYLTSADNVLTGPTSGQYIWAWGAVIEETRAASVSNRVSGVAWAQATVDKQPLRATLNDDATKPACMKMFGVQGLVSGESAVLATFQNSAVQTLFQVVAAVLVTGASAFIAGGIGTSTQPYRFMLRNTTRIGWEMRPDVGIDVLVQSGTTVFAVNTPYVLEGYYNGTAAYIARNGNTSFFSPNPNTAATGTTTMTQVVVGGWGALSNSNHIGTFGSAIVYNRVLSTADLAYTRFGLGYQWRVTVV